MFFILYKRFPFAVNIAAGPVMAYIAVIMNSLIFMLLLSKKLQSPSAAIMQGLAIADALSAMFLYGLEPCFINFYRTVSLLNISESKNELVDLKFPYCCIHFYANHVAELFHLVSVLLTACLGMQKTICVFCPLWSRYGMNIKRSRICCLFCVILATFVSVPKMLVVSFVHNETDNACQMRARNHHLVTYVLNIFPLINASILGVCCGSMCFSSAVLIYKLLSRKFKTQSIDRNQKRSCVLIVAVVIVFLLTELPRLFLNGAVFSTYQSNFGERDMVWKKVVVGIDTRAMNCIKESDESWVESGLTGGTWVDIYGNAYADNTLTCFFRIKEHQKSYIVEQKGLGVIGYRDIKDWISRSTPNLPQGTLFFKIAEKILLEWNKQVSKALETIAASRMCNVVKLEENVKMSSICPNELVYTIKENLVITALSSTPYSDPMNYLSIPIWSYFEISLEEIKLFLEIMKMSTIAGCVSNFVLYIGMSKNLRSVLFQKLRRQK